MMKKKKKHENQAIISISDDEELEQDSERNIGDSDGDYDEIESDTGDDDDDDDDEASCTDNDDDDNGKVNDERISHKVTCLLIEGGSELEELSLNECKTYLRNLGLRLSGTKSECINRINEHWRIKDGKGEAQYPRSSFCINCTGDVCSGDVVLFRQKVYEKFDKKIRSGNTVGKRTIAGRIVKESYGAAKQQHTFTVEVLWSKGITKLPPLFPLLVKGRNLYKMKTFRQRWKNESDRRIVLAEKHKRGAAAREVRSLKKSKKTLCANTGAKDKKPFHRKTCQLNQYTEVNKRKCFHQWKNAPRKNLHPKDHHKNALSVAQVNMKHLTKSRPSTSYTRKQNYSQPKEVRDSTFQFYSPQDFHHFQREFHHQRAVLSYPLERGSTSSMMRMPDSRLYTDFYSMPVSEHRGYNHRSYPQYSYSSLIHEPRARNFNGFHESVEAYRPLHPLPNRIGTYGQRRQGF